VGGILGLSSIIVTSPESISMISEAASSRAPTLVFKAEGLSPKHRAFLDNLATQNYIYLSAAGDLAQEISRIWRDRPVRNTLKDNAAVSQALGKIL